MSGHLPGPLPSDDDVADEICSRPFGEWRNVRDIPVLTLLPTQFVTCVCGALRVHHEMDHTIHALGKCVRTKCEWFLARDEDMPQPEPPRRRW